MPGVAVPVLKIAENPEKAYDYTAKSNLVAVISNGSAILGLGNRGALASKPVMEGKGVLFKAFADIGIFDMLSFSNFGSTRHPLSEKVRKAVELIRDKRPDLVVDGEMQADTAVVPEIIEDRYPFSQVKDANVLVFPSLESANISLQVALQVGESPCHWSHPAWAGCAHPCTADGEMRSRILCTSLP
ncbi:MAG: hypothetical protein A2Z14_11915 [Chloroflexi bacterium RBG_16_48_8]|nr:MAG: hypothetical protein A2Z14_11915 [Chloroflexi bacterium RBG_16_48_8]